MEAGYERTRSLDGLDVLLLGAYGTDLRKFVCAVFHGRSAPDIAGDPGGVPRRAESSAGRPAVRTPVRQQADQ
jgi:hypothetical protein